jgi:CubicO group peptidase (beta-lactamase class C family)
MSLNINCIKHVIALIALLLSFDQFLSAQSSIVTRRSDLKIASKVNEYMKAAERVNRFSGSILITRDGLPIINKGYGMANYELKVPNTPQTVYQLGSITKQFTSMAIMMLQERGKLKTTDAICQYISDCPVAWQNITVRHLLSHTSGIPNYTSIPDFGKIQVMSIPPPGLMEMFRNKPLEFTPGEQWKYSNSGYYLLGVIIERVSGKTYADFLQENIFTPLDLKHTGYGSHSLIIENRASGYALQGDTLLNADYGDMTIPYAAGALYSTTEDLLIWDQALYTEKLISRNSFDEMFTPIKNNYAYGWENKKKYDHRVLEHGGDIDGFACFISRFIDDHITIIVLGNRERSAARKTANDLAAIVFGAPYTIPQERKTVSLNTKTLEKYIGQYRIGPNLLSAITLENGHLMVQATGQPKLQIYAESETNFFFKSIIAEIVFVKNKQTSVPGLIFRQGKNDIPGQKIT